MAAFACKYICNECTISLSAAVTPALAMLIGVQELDASLLPTHLLPFPLLSVRLTSLRQRGAASQQEKDGKE